MNTEEQDAIINNLEAVMAVEGKLKDYQKELLIKLIKPIKQNMMRKMGETSVQAIFQELIEEFEKIEETKNGLKKK